MHGITSGTSHWRKKSAVKAFTDAFMVGAIDGAALRCVFKAVVFVASKLRIGSAFVTFIKQALDLKYGKHRSTWR
jgi:hypothetical protein